MSNGKHPRGGSGARERDERDHRPRLILGRPRGDAPEHFRDLAERMAEALLGERPDGDAGGGLIGDRPRSRR